MARRVYTPPSRPNNGANVRLGPAEVEDHINHSIGGRLLRKITGPDTVSSHYDGEGAPDPEYISGTSARGARTSLTQKSADADGAIASRRGSFSSPSRSARNQLYGRDVGGGPVPGPAGGDNSQNQSWVYPYPYPINPFIRTPSTLEAVIVSPKNITVHYPYDLTASFSIVSSYSDLTAYNVSTIATWTTDNVTTTVLTGTVVVLPP